MVALDAGSALAVHTLFEMGGVFTGMRLYAVNMRGHALGSIARGSSYAVALGCIAGAIA